MSAVAVLGMPTLVLNRNWVAISQTTVREALCLMAKGSAQAVSPDYRLYDLDDWASLRAMEGHPVVRTVSLEVPIPTVIRVLGYDRLPSRGVVFSRRNLFKRDHYACQYCGRQARTEDLTIDHVLPKSRGGVSSWENCVLACIECNKRKDNRTPAEARMRLRRRPEKPGPRAVLAIPVARVYESWRHFVSRAYWDAELLP